MDNKKLHTRIRPRQRGAVIAVSVSLLAWTLSVSAQNITIDVSKDRGPVNRAVLGNNMLGFPKAWNDPSKSFRYPGHHVSGTGVWDPLSRSSIVEMVNFAKDIGMTFTRFPGGNGVHWYDWKDGVGPFSSRPLFPSSDDPDNPNPVPISYGLSEFLKNTRDIGATPVITVSDFSATGLTATPRDAADLVEYLNAPSGTNPNGGKAWADIRDADRRSLGLTAGPWNVIWFEYGNETYAGDGSNAAHVMTADQYATNYLDHRAAMRAVDGRIKLGAVLESPGNVNEWSTTVMLGTGGVADFYITHNYTLWYTQNNGIPDAATLFSIGLAGTDAQLRASYRQLNQLILDITGRIVPLAVTEYNGGFAQKDPIPYRHSLGTALMNAEHIRQLMQAANIAFANHWHFANDYWGMIKGYTPRPNYYPFQFYSHYFGDRLVSVEAIAVPTYGSSGGYGVAPVSNAGVYTESVVDAANLLEGKAWSLTPIEGAYATESAGVLSVQFDSKDVDFQHASKTLQPVGSEAYRLSGIVNTTRLEDPKGILLEVRGLDRLGNVGGFENGFGGWTTLTNADLRGTSYSFDPAVAYQGTMSAKVVFPSPGVDVNFYHVFHDIPVSPATRYMLEGYIKTEGMTIGGGGRGVEIAAQDVDGPGDGGFWATNSIGETTGGWRRVSVQFTTKSATRAVRISLRRRSGNGTGTISGTAWWDGVRLYNYAGTVAHSGKPPRYVSIDFKPETDVGALSVVVRRTSGGAALGAAEISDVKLRRLTPGSIGAVPFLSLNASTSQDGSKAYIMVVNKHMTDIISPTISIAQDTPYSARSWTLTGNAIDSTNEANLPGVAVTAQEVGAVANGFNYSFPPRSLTALEIRLKGPADLISSALSATKSNTALTIKDAVKNQGGTPAGQFAINYYLSRDTVFDSSDTLLCSRTVNALAAGTSDPATGTVTTVCAKPRLSGGAYYVLAVSDAANRVYERNENNNTKTAGLR